MRGRPRICKRCNCPDYSSLATECDLCHGQLVGGDNIEGDKRCPGSKHSSETDTITSVANLIVKDIGAKPRYFTQSIVSFYHIGAQPYSHSYAIHLEDLAPGTAGRLLALRDNERGIVLRQAAGIMLRPVDPLLFDDHVVYVLRVVMFSKGRAVANYGMEVACRG